MPAQPTDLAGVAGACQLLQFGLEHLMNPEKPQRDERPDELDPGIELQALDLLPAHHPGLAHPAALLASCDCL
ncbi:MAG: hypothetical protein HYZ11_18795 [Candidatus Tectomicrobia bacterium]|uniref:Uncharacterized protein n=1 Tax=Tectimicrobiota bacterium TaxID=2528274 RepID=A0A932I4M0_UNCTE|nr:hypothetical protein [Candidatus Tectomicrobia bacterium]